MIQSYFKNLTLEQGNLKSAVTVREATVIINRVNRKPWRGGCLSSKHSLWLRPMTVASVGSRKKIKGKPVVLQPAAHLRRLGCITVPRDRRKYVSFFFSFPVVWRDSIFCERLHVTVLTARLVLTNAATACVCLRMFKKFSMSWNPVECKSEWPGFHPRLAERRGKGSIFRVSPPSQGRSCSPSGLPRRDLSHFSRSAGFIYVIKTRKHDGGTSHVVPVE